ncbi:MAG: NAD-binding protein [Pseudomonadales bacterium]|nr:NAD-binding protein [Pseudomonadales bacterium]
MNSVIPILLRRMRTPLVVLIVAYSIATVGFTLIPGVDDEGNPWTMSFFEAFYVVSYTGSTIGFGEVPYAFSNGQRLWTIVSIYLTVFSWLYSVGTIISLIQDHAFRHLLSRVQLQRSLKGFTDPFYIVCGYGDTGKLLVRALLRRGMRAVVIDQHPEAIDLLRIKDMGVHVPGFTVDAEIPENLLAAGLRHPCCEGVLAVTGNAHANLKVAITVKLLNPSSWVFCRASNEENANNMLSFGTDLVVSPEKDFARRLLLSIREPDTHKVYDWLTAIPDTPLPDRPEPPRGHWIICGFEQLGRATYQALKDEGVDVTVITPDTRQPGVPGSSISGKGTEAVTLQQAGIERASALLAVTRDDADNLSILMTARALNPNLYLGFLQNRLHNRALFQAVDAELPVQTSFLTASRFLSVINAPLLPEFLVAAEKQGNAWNETLTEKIQGVIGDMTPATWHLTFNASETSAVALAHRLGEPVTLRQLCRDPHHWSDTLKALPLMLRRDGENTLLPDLDTRIEPDDELLVCGTSRARRQMIWTLNHRNALRYVQTGEQRPDGLVWRWLARRRAAPADVGDQG